MLDATAQATIGIREVPDFESLPDNWVASAAPRPKPFTVADLIEALEQWPSNAPVIVRNLAFDEAFNPHRIQAMYVDTTPGAMALVIDVGELLVGEPGNAVPVGDYDQFIRDEFAPTSGPQRGGAQGPDEMNPRRGTGGPAGDEADGGEGDAINPPTGDDAGGLGSDTDPDDEFEGEESGDEDADTDEE